MLHVTAFSFDTQVHSASSDEDDSSQIHQSSKTKLTSGTKKGKESRFAELYILHALYSCVPSGNRL